MASTQRAGLFFIFLTLTLDTMGYGLADPIVPRLIARMQGGGISNAAHALGIALAAYSAALFVCSPLQGALSDRFGRRPLLLVALTGTALAYLLLAWAPTLPWLYAAEVLDGVTGASVTVASAYIADASAENKRAESFGILGAAFGVGFVTGPAVGGLLSVWGLRTPFYAAALLAGLNVLYGFFAMRESHPGSPGAPLTRRELNPFRSFGLLRAPTVMALSAVLVCIYLAIEFLQSTWVLSTAYRFHWSVVQTGFSLAAIGLVAAVVQGGLIHWIVPRLGERRTILLGLASGVLTFGLYGAVRSGWAMVLAIALGGLTGLAMPGVRAAISERTSPRQQGEVQGALTSLTTLTAVVGPLVGASAFGYFTGPQAPFKLPGIPFFLGMATYVIALAIALSALRRSREATPSVTIAQAPSTEPASRAPEG